MVDAKPFDGDAGTLLQGRGETPELRGPRNFPAVDRIYTWPADIA